MRPFLLLVLLAAVPYPASRVTEAQEAAGAVHRAHPPAQLSTVLSIRVGGKHLVLSVADLQALPQTSVTVLNGHTKTEETYTGPLVSDVLAKAGAPLSGAAEHDVLRSYVVATGTDGYFVVFSGVELQSTLHKGQCIVALTRAGQPLTENGAFQIVDTLDVKPARWVRNLSGLAVMPVALTQEVRAD